MPRAWSNKDERQYEHIRDSARKDGKSADRAKEIAARTVNKHRRAEGRAAAPKSRATGNPNNSLDSRTKTELYNRAVQLKIRGRSQMNKQELAKAIRNH